MIGRGVTSTGGKISARSGGFIPNFASPEMAEIYGAYLGGYKPGKVSRMNIPGEGSVVYNQAERVKKFPGMVQPAIIPPAGSSAGQRYSQAFQNKLGFNPYAASGFVPNFNLASNDIIRQNEGTSQKTNQPTIQQTNKQTNAPTKQQTKQSTFNLAFNPSPG